jgi:hypothetical protein
MKIITILLIQCIASTCLFAGDRTRDVIAASSEKEGKSGPSELDSSVIEHVYTSFGLITTIHLATDNTIEDLKFGSDILTYEYDAEQNLLHLMPRIQSGVTNMNMMIDGKVHVFIIHIESDPRVQYRRTFTMKQDSRTQANLENAPVLQPGDVPVIPLIRIIERLQKDPTYASQVPNMRQLDVSKSYKWNGCDIQLKGVYQFPHIDTLVFRIEWQNVTNKLLYLNCRQYLLKIFNEKIPVTSATQNRESIYPGEMDQVYLFVQGHRLRLENEWELMLPPDEESVVRLYQK